MYKVVLEQVLFSVVLWLIAFFTYKSALLPNKQDRGNYNIFFFIVITYCVFAFTAGDFPHYHESYDNLYKGAPQYSLEDFYYNLILTLPNSYYLWRFIVWGLSTVLLILTFKRLKSPVNLSCLIFVLVLMEYFSAPRNTLGYVMLYYSLTFIIKPIKNKVLSYAIAIAGIYICTFFHKSMPLYILLALISFFPLKKWMYLASFALFPVVYASFRLLSQYVLSFDFGDESFQNTGSNYLEGENFAVSNLNGYIRLFINRLPIFIIIYYLLSRILKGEIQNKAAIYFSRYAYILIYISLVFFNQPTSSFLSTRFWDASTYPLVFAMPFAFYMKREVVVDVVYKLLMISCFFNLFLHLYTAF